MRFTYLILSFGLVLLLCGCREQAPTLTPFATPSLLPPTTTPLPTETTSLYAETPLHGILVWVSAGNEAGASPEGHGTYWTVEPGSTLPLVLHLEPVVLTRLFTNKNIFAGASSQPWENAPARWMRTCLSLKQACQPDGEWQPFQSELPLELEVGWLGPRPVYLGAQVSDSNEQPLLTFNVSMNYHASPVALLELQVSGKLSFFHFRLPI